MKNRLRIIEHSVELWPLMLVIILSLFLRLLLPGTPPSLNWDEVSHGYNAYSILDSGADEWGVNMPLIFRSYGDYKLPVYIYLTSLAELFFGVNMFSVRLISIFAGVGSASLVYLLIKQFLESRNKLFSPKIIRVFSLLGAILMAIEPWSFFLSRIAVEANLAMFFFLAGFYTFHKFVSGKAVWLIISSILFGLTMWTYNSYRIMTPLTVLSLTAIYFKEIKNTFIKEKIILILISLVVVMFSLPLGIQLMNSEGKARYSKVEILDEGAIAKINESRALGGSRLLNNKLTYFAKEFTGNYISHFNPEFLYLKGGSNYQFNIPGRGILFIPGILFMYLGIFLTISGLIKEKNRYLLTIILWLVLAPIASSVTREAPHTLRAITMLPLPMVFTVVGITFFYQKYKKIFPFIIGTIILLYAVSAEGYFMNYFNSYRVNYSQSWQYGYKELSQYISKNYGKYDKVIVTKKYGETHEFLLFYGAEMEAPWSWQPEKFRSDPNLVRFYQSDWYWVDSFDKFSFVNDWQVKERDDPYSFILESDNVVDCDPGVFKCLLATSPGNVPRGWKMIKQINFLDGKPSFELYENIN